MAPKETEIQNGKEKSVENESKKGEENTKSVYPELIKTPSLGEKV